LVLYANIIKRNDKESCRIPAGVGLVWLNSKEANLNHRLFKIRVNQKYKTASQQKNKRLKPGFPVLWEATLAIDRSSFGWLKWYFAIYTAV
jgi:hypothetical protein